MAKKKAYKKPTPAPAIKKAIKEKPKAEKPKGPGKDRPINEADGQANGRPLRYY